MNITAADLKRALKPLSSVKTETFHVSESGLSAQDSDVWVVVEFPLNGIGTPFNIDGKKLTQVVNRMGGQIEIERGEKTIVLKSAKARVELEIQPTKPLLQNFDPRDSMSFEAVSFKKNLAESARNAFTNRSSPSGNVVKLETLPLGIEDENPSGYRLVSMGNKEQFMTVVTQKAELPKEINVLINLSACSVVQLMDGKTIDLLETNSGLQIKSGNTTVYVSKTTQKYPNYGAFLALTSLFVVEYKPEEWLSALRTVEPLIDESVDQGGVALHFKDGVVHWSNIGVGSSGSDESPYEQIEPDPIFEPKYLKIRLKAEYVSGFLSKASGVSKFQLLEGKTIAVKFSSGNVDMVLKAMIAPKEKK
jgi:hypothetical protein